MPTWAPSGLQHPKMWRDTYLQSKHVFLLLMIYDNRFKKLTLNRSESGVQSIVRAFNTKNLGRAFILHVAILIINMFCFICLLFRPAWEYNRVYRVHLFLYFYKNAISMVSKYTVCMDGYVKHDQRRRNVKRVTESATLVTKRAEHVPSPCTTTLPYRSMRRKFWKKEKKKKKEILRTIRSDLRHV